MSSSRQRGAQETSDDDLAASLATLGAGYDSKRRLLRVLHSAPARRSIGALAEGCGGDADATRQTWRLCPLGGPPFEALWREVSDLTHALLQIEAAPLRQACARWTAGGTAARYVADLLAGPGGVLARVRCEAAFLAARDACLADPATVRVRTLARQTPAFAADLAADVDMFGRALHELHVRGRAPVELRVYGFGEISRTVGLVRPRVPLVQTIEPQKLVYKRLAPFPRADLAARYVQTYDEYNRRLSDEVGITVPEFGHRTVRGARGRTVVLVTQTLLDPQANGKEILRRRDVEQCRILFGMVLDEYRKLVRYNRERAAVGFALGLDGQIPNWVVRDYRGEGVPLRGDEGLFFLDTNTPLMRVHGRDCLPMAFYLQAVPRLLRPLVRPMARKVLDRYFNPRTILLDFLANTSIHGRADLVDVLLPEANAFLADGLIQPAPRPITKAEVERYITNDVATWRLTRSIRTVEEMLRGKRGPVDTVRHIRAIYTQPLF